MSSVDRFLASNMGTIDWLWKQNPTIDPIFLTLVMPCRDPQSWFVPPPDNRTLCYFGTLHKNRFIKEMVMAMTKLTARLMIAGPKTNDLYDWVKRQADGKRVIFLGHLDEPEVIEKIRHSDIVVSMLNPADRCLSVGLANKVFDSMSIGRAAIGTTGTATGNLIEEVGMGLTTRYNLDSYIDGIHALFSQNLKQLGRRAYEAGKTKYNWQNQAEKLVNVFAEISE